MTSLSPAASFSSSSSSQVRIAVVQHGDYAHARQLMEAGQPEIYTGQRYTIDSFDQFFGSLPHLIVSLEGDTPPMRRGSGEYVCVRPRRIRGIPGRFTMHWAARQILWKLNRFKPTHILLRNSDLIGREILIWANRRRIPTAVITAMRFDPALRECRRFCQLANDDNVMLVANHLPAATASMTHAGLRAGKAIAYDFPPSVNPGDFESKRAPAGREMTLLFVGVMSEAKGVLDFLRAGERLRKAGRSVNLTFLGDGPARPTVVAHPGIADKWITSPGRVGHDEVLKRMRESEILVVPSRPTFAEGMPFVIAEGLAVRTPLVVSDHPIFVQYFREGQGVRFYPAGDDAALADRIVTLLDDPEQYEQLSRASADAWASFQVDTKFHHLLERLSREWAMS